jgi:hypothetical protein
MKIIEFYGRSPVEILRRYTVLDNLLADYRKTDEIDDMMKQIVTQSFVPAYNVPAGEFAIDAEVGMGPVITHEFPNKVVLDVLEELKDASISLHELNGTYKIYYDVVEDDSLVTNGFGYRFRTYAGLRGSDRTNGVVFSPENGNIRNAYYYEDYLEEANSILVYSVGYDGVAEDNVQINASRWNRIAKNTFGIENTNANTTTANSLLRKSAGRAIFNADFLSTPGALNYQPRCLYRVDWDLGDLVPVQFAGKNFNAMISIVYVSVNEAGEENILARTLVGE